MKRRFVAVGIGGRLVLEAVARPDLVDPDAVAPPGRRHAVVRSAERRVHRPLDAGDLDLDPTDQVDRRGVLVAAVRRGVAPRRASRAWSSRSSSRGLCGSVVPAVGPCAASVSAIAACFFSRHRPQRTASSVPTRASRSGLDRSPSRWPRVDLVAGSTTSSSATRPGVGAATTCSIFIASSVTTGSPASTASPDRDVDRQDGAGHRRDERRPGRRRGRARRGRGAARSTSGGGASRNGDAATGEVDVDACRRRGRARLSRPARPAASATVAGRRPRRRAGSPAAAFSRQPPTTDQVAARGRVRAAPRPRRPRVVRDRGPRRPSRPAARSDRACRSGPAPSRTAGSRTSQRRNRRFVVSPRTTVVVERVGQAVERLGAVARRGR